MLNKNKASAHPSDNSKGTIDREPIWIDVLPFYFPFVLSVVPEIYSGHNGDLRPALIALWVGYVLTPALDYLLPHDTTNLNKKRVASFEKDKRFLVPLYAYWLIEMIRIYWQLRDCKNGLFTLDKPFEFVTFSIICANASALNIVVGHELLHRRQLVHKVSGTLVYSKMLYSHFYIEHRKGHHTFVGTPRDPATA